MRRHWVFCSKVAYKRLSSGYPEGRQARIDIRWYTFVQRRSQESTKPGLASSSSSSSFLQPLLAFFFLLMAVARAKPGLHVNHGRRGGWSTGSPPAGFVAAFVPRNFVGLYSLCLKTIGVLALLSRFKAGPFGQRVHTICRFDIHNQGGKLVLTYDRHGRI